MPEDGPPDLEGGGGFFGCGGFAGIPFFVFLDGNDSDFGLHVVVAGAAELAAGEFEFRRAGGGELHPLDGASGDGILVEAEGWDVERVDHIAGAEEDMDGLTDGDDQLGGGEVVLGGGVCGIDAEFVFDAEALHIAFSELAISSGIAQIPAELVTHDVYGNGIRCDRRLGEFIPDAVRPYGEEEEDGGWNDGPPKFEGVVAVAVVGLVTWAATIADEIDDVNDLCQNEYHQREDEDEIEEVVDFFAANGDIWRSPIEIGSALLGLSGKGSADEQECGDGKDSQQEVHSRVKSGGGRCGRSRGCRSGRRCASCGNCLCGNGFKFFLCPRIFSIRTGGADCLDIVGSDRRSCIAPLGADVGEDRCDLVVFELRPWWHGVVVGVALDLHRPLHAGKKDFDEVVITHPSSADDPFAGYEGRELSGDANAGALVADGTILAVETLADHFGIGSDGWTAASPAAP